MSTASSIAGGGKSVGREKSGMGAVPKGSEVAVGLLESATAAAAVPAVVLALGRAVVRVKKRAVRATSGEAWSCIMQVAGAWMGAGSEREAAEVETLVYCSESKKAGEGRLGRAGFVGDPGDKTRAA
jgi:hypothetical protein